MTTRKAKAVRAALEAKGMTASQNHHTMFRKEVDGVTTLITRVSHGSSEIGEGLATLMARQCCLHTREFWRLVDCPLTADEWDRLVRERCADGKNPMIGGR